MSIALPGGALIVGIDIGGTKTHLRLMGEGRAQDRVLPSADWRLRNWGDDATALLAMVHDLVEGAPVAAIGIGAHGCDDASECDAFQAAFAARTAVPVAVVNDAELMPLALGLHGQIGLVAGTGSIAVSRGAGGQMLVAGGYGWIIGDDGSSAALVRDAARAVAVHFDRTGALDDPLCGLLFSRLGIPSAARIGSVLASFGSAAAVGAHAELVFEAAAQGSVLARDVIHRNGDALAELVEMLVDRGVRATDVVAGGSVIVAQAALWQSFSEGLAARLGDRITPHLFSGKPVEGACHLAASLAASGTERIPVRVRS